MIEFAQNADPHARDINRDGITIGSLQWHEGRKPRLVLHENCEDILSLEDVLRCIREYERITGKKVTLS